MTTLRKVNVEIAGQQVSLFTDGAPDRVQAAVALVNNTMDGIFQATKAPLTHKTAILAALKLAEDILDLKSELKMVRSDAAKLADQAIHVIDGILDPPQS